MSRVACLFPHAARRSRFELRTDRRALSSIWRQLEQRKDNSRAVVAQPRDGIDSVRGCEPFRFKLFSMLSPLFPYLEVGRLSNSDATGRGPPHLPRKTKGNYTSAKRHSCRYSVARQFNHLTISKRNDLIFPASPNVSRRTRNVEVRTTAMHNTLDRLNYR